MATGNRTLKLSILADVDDLKKKLGEADKAVETNSSKISEFGKKAAAAFAVAAAAAVAYGTKLAIDGVKAAIEDEQAQLRLAAALRTATGATEGQIRATEDFILQTSLATGVADEQLRPAMQRLAVSTKTELATLSFTEIQTKLSDLYGGAAATNAETFQGKIDRLKVGFDEAKESLGVALLPAVEQFITFLNDTGIPTLNAFIAGLTGDKGLSAGLAETQRGAEGFGKAIGSVVGIIQGFITFLREAIGLVVSLANELIRVVNIIPGVNIGSIPNPAPSASRSSLPSVPKGGSNFTYGAGNPAVTNIYVSAIDGEGAARAVGKVVNQSAARSVPVFTGNGIRLN